jgi:hypothetical protein
MKKECDWCGCDLEEGVVFDVAGDIICEDCHEDHLYDERMIREYEDLATEAVETKHEMMRDNSL